MPFPHLGPLRTVSVACTRVSNNVGSTDSKLDLAEDVLDAVTCAFSVGCSRERGKTSFGRTTLRLVKFPYHPRKVQRPTNQDASSLFSSSFVLVDSFLSVIGGFPCLAGGLQGMLGPLERLGCECLRGPCMRTDRMGMECEAADEQCSRCVRLMRCRSITATSSISKTGADVTHNEIQMTYKRENRHATYREDTVSVLTLNPAPLQR